jgi:mannose-6-phosphate isomerase-like protein (cupin superfamily)
MSEEITGNFYLQDTFLDWCARQAVPVIEDFGIDLLQIETAPWDRFGMNGTICELAGGDDYVSTFLFEIPPGGQSNQLSHVYEEVVFVLEGHGSTKVELPNGQSHTFEWGPNSLFQVPLNLKYQHFNGSGSERVRLACNNDLRFIMNLFRSERFIWENPIPFQERMGDPSYFTGEGQLKPVKPGRHQWETNFVPDISSFDLKAWDARGPGSSNLRWILADGTIGCHTSQMPVGTYKKGHRHTAGTNVYCVSGQGYSLFWYEGDEEFKRVDWHHGVIYTPPENMLHQHFNSTSTPSRYLAVQMGSTRYPLFAVKRQIWDQGVDTSIKDGGNQVEYEDQDPRIHGIFLKELAKNQVKSLMGDSIDESKY